MIHSNCILLRFGSIYCYLVEYRRAHPWEDSWLVLSNLALAPMVQGRDGYILAESDAAGVGIFVRSIDTSIDTPIHGLFGPGGHIQVGAPRLTSCLANVTKIRYSN